MLGVFRSRRVLVVALLGFASGLPYLLTGQTLGAWMTAEDVDLGTIAAFSLVALPYSIKWTWAPLLDRFGVPLLGRRRGWLLVLQLALVAAIAAMGSIDPHRAPAALAGAAVVVALLSASHDVVVDAFNTDTLRAEERAAGAAMYVTGYRAAMLTTGAFALALADRVTWQAIYLGVAGLMLLGVGATLLADEPPAPDARPRTIAEAVVRPVRLLLAQPRIAIVLGFVALYRLCDFFATLMIVPFLKKGLGFSFAEIATAYHLLGFSGTMLGGVLGGGLVARLGMRRCLVAFGALQAATNLLWAALAGAEPSLALLGAVVVVDTFAGAMAGSVFVAFLMSRCDPSVSATQYALLTSLSSLGMRVLGFLAAVVVGAGGWSGYWVATAALAVPALALVPLLPERQA